MMKGVVGRQRPPFAPLEPPEAEGWDAAEINAEKLTAKEVDLSLMPGFFADLPPEPEEAPRPEELPPPTRIRPEEALEDENVRDETEAEAFERRWRFDPEGQAAAEDEETPGCCGSGEARSALARRPPPSGEDDSRGLGAQLRSSRRDATARTGAQRGSRHRVRFALGKRAPPRRESHLSQSGFNSVVPFPIHGPGPSAVACRRFATAAS